VAVDSATPAGGPQVADPWAGYILLENARTVTWKPCSAGHDSLSV
jgi:hypothetical protein